MYVYKVIHRDSGRAYIGATRKLVAVRWGEHVSSSKNLTKVATTPLHFAIAKFGVGAFDLLVLYRAVDEREMHAVERGAISAHGTLAPHGYNHTCGGPKEIPIKSTWVNGIAAANSARSIAKRSVALRGQTRTDVQRKRIAEARRGKGVLNLHAAHLLPHEVDEIRNRLAEGQRQKEIAMIFGVNHSAISNIKTGVRWARTRPVKPPSAR